MRSSAHINGHPIHPMLVGFPIALILAWAFDITPQGIRTTPQITSPGTRRRRLFQWRRNQEFAKSKGWIRDYHIFGTVNARAGEPDLYLVSVYDRQPTAAEQMAREKEMNAFLQQDTRQQDTAFGGRANMRKIGGSMLMQELRFRR